MHCTLKSETCKISFYLYNFFLLNIYRIIVCGSKEHLHFFICVQFYFILPILIAYYYIFPLMFKHFYDNHIYFLLILWIFSVILHLICFFKDPGIIPKNIKEINLSKLRRGVDVYESKSLTQDKGDNNNKVYLSNSRLELSTEDISGIKNYNNSYIDLNSNLDNYNENYSNDINTINKHNHNHNQDFSNSYNMNSCNSHNHSHGNNTMKSDFINNKKQDLSKINIKEMIPHIFTERYCDTCKITRPPGASHCRFCDNCIEGFDQ